MCSPSQAAAMRNVFKIQSNLLRAHGSSYFGSTNGKWQALKTLSGDQMEEKDTRRNVRSFILQTSFLKMVARAIPGSLGRGTPHPPAWVHQLTLKHRQEAQPAALRGWSHPRQRPPKPERFVFLFTSGPTPSPSRSRLHYTPVAGARCRQCWRHETQARRFEDAT